MNSNPLFSIIVANYNNGSYLKELVDSVFMQTYSNWQLVIVDDKSTDNSAEILATFSDPRIITAINPMNHGAAYTFGRAVELSSGEFIGMLGADDALVPEALEIMVQKHLDHPEVSMINSDAYWCDENLKIIGIYPHYKAVPENSSLIFHLTVGSFATFKRSSYEKTEGFDPQFLKALDHDIYLKLDEVGQLKYVSKPLYLYRQNPMGISQNANGVIAANYSRLAVYLACRRRKNIMLPKLPFSELKELRIDWYRNEIYYYRLNHNYLKIKYILKIWLLEFPLSIFNIQYLKNLRFLFK